MRAGQVSRNPMAERALDELIEDLKALHEAIPEILLILTMAKARAREEAADA